MDTPEDFAEFWRIYPKKVAKQAALKAWRKLKASPNLVMTILADVERRRESPDWTKDGGQFIPHPATYLNGQRWEDEWEPTSAHEPVYAGLKSFVERNR